MQSGDDVDDPGHPGLTVETGGDRPGNQVRQARSVETGGQQVQDVELIGHGRSDQAIDRWPMIASCACSKACRARRHGRCSAVSPWVQARQASPVVARLILILCRVYEVSCNFPLEAGLQTQAAGSQTTRRGGSVCRRHACRAGRLDTEGRGHRGSRFARGARGARTRD